MSAPALSVRRVAPGAAAGAALVAASRATGRDTHGRWPIVAAVAAPTTTAAALGARDWLARDLRWATWLPLPILFWHQTEEWVLPAGFMPWINRTVLESNDDEFPITPRVGFVVNVVVGWGMSLAAATAKRRTPAPIAAVLASHVANSALHIGAAVRQRRYNPGAASAALLLGPIGAGGLAALVAQSPGRRREVAAGMTQGTVASLLTFRRLRRRMRAS